MVSLGLGCCCFCRLRAVALHVQGQNDVWWFGAWAWESSLEFRFLLYLFSLCPRARPNLPVPSELF